MKKLILCFILILLASITNAQPYNNWITVGGNSNRDGRNDNFFDAFGPINQIYTAPSTLWGMPVFSFGSRFVTTRYTSLSPLRALISAFTFNTLNPIWNYGVTSGVNIIMGFNNDMVYVRDFQQNGYDTIFALQANDGSLIWKSRFTVERGIIWTAVFASNGDLIVPGSDTKRIMRINYLNGDTVWTNSRIIPNTGAECFCINGNTLYAWQGSITTPKTIIAIDLNTGITKYSSVTLPGDGDQEIPFTVSLNGTVYCIRDGGLMYALNDNGTGFDTKWSRFVPQPVGTYSQIAIGKDSSVFIPYGNKIYRLNHQTGEALDSSIDLITSGTINPRFAIGRLGYIYVGNGASEPSQGKFFVFNQNLHTLINQYGSPYNYYCGPSFGGGTLNPHLLLCGAGTQINSQVQYIDEININNSFTPDKFELEQNYPNPFNPKTIINYQCSIFNFVSLRIYDILGNEVAILVNQNQDAGNYNIEFDGSNFSSGIYFYKLTIAGNTETRMMNLIK